MRWPRLCGYYRGVFIRLWGESLTMSLQYVKRSKSWVVLRVSVISLLIVLFCCKVGEATIVIGQTSDFEDGTTQSWTDGGSGGGFFVTHTNIPNGGPTGVGDNFLQVSQTSTGRLATVNDSSGWTGDYQAASVTGVRADLNTTHSTPLDIRLVLFDGFNQLADRWTSTNSFTLPNDGLWHTFTFSVQQADLTNVAPINPGTYNSIITNVQRLMFRHQSGPASSQGSTLTLATFNIDNIVAIPEPPSLETTFIKAGSTAWDPLFRQFVDPSDSLGIDVEAAANSPLAQVNVNELYVQFSKDVNVTSGDLLLTGDTVADYSGLISGFDYDSGTFLATWTLSEPLEADRLNLQLAAVTDLAGNPLVATSVDFTALPADSNQDEVVLSDDLVQVRNLQFELITGLGTATSNYSPRHDLNGDGVILSDDLVLSRNHQFSVLPLPPTASIPEPSTCFLLMLGALPLRSILRRRNA